MFDQQVALLASTQYGVFARFQLLALGIEPTLIKRRLRSGHWIRLAPGVYGLPGHRDTWDQRLWVTYLAAGEQSFVCRDAAAASFRVEGFPKQALTVVVLHPQNLRVAGATVHQTRYLPRHHWLMFNGRRTTTLARTLVDLAATTSRLRLDLAYESAIVSDHLTYAKMSRCFFELLHPGRKGMTKLASILDDRGPGSVPAASELERILFEVCGRVQLEPVRQFPLPGRGEVTGFVDAAFVEAKLILEADGRRWHDRVATQRKDRARVNAAARVGWQTLRFGWEELTSDPDGEGATIRDTYDERVALLAARP